MAKQEQRDSYTPWQIQRFQEELVTLQQACDLAQAIQEVDPDLASFTAKWLNEAQGIQASFEFLLSGNADPESHRFAAWINHPQFLLNDIQGSIKLFGVDLERHQTVETTAQLTLL